jgi:phosphotransacetylase
VKPMRCYVALVGRYQKKAKHVLDILGCDHGEEKVAALSAVLNDKGVFFFTDTHMQFDPTAEQIAESALQAALSPTPVWRRTEGRLDQPQ